MNQPSPIELQRYLKGVDYPAGREDLVRHAESQGADQETLQRLQKLPDRTFEGPSGVSEAFSAAG